MITIKTEDGKFFFSEFLNLHEEQEATLDETILSLENLKYILVAIESGRLTASEGDISTLLAAIATKENTGGSGGEFDPSLIEGKEDKSNKVQVLGAGSATQYPSTAAVVSGLTPYAKTANITKASVGLGNVDNTSDALKPISNSTQTALNLKATKSELALKLDTPTSTLPTTVTTPTVNSIPLFTIGNGGDYVLCTPDAWLLIGGFYVHAYSKSTINPPA